MDPEGEESDRFRFTENLVTGVLVLLGCFQIVLRNFFHSGILWAGTYYYGVFNLPPYAEWIKYYALRRGVDLRLAQKSISSPWLHPSLKWPHETRRIVPEPHRGSSRRRPRAIRPTRR